MAERRAIQDEAIQDNTPGIIPDAGTRTALDLTPGIVAEGEGKWWGNPDLWNNIEDISVAVHDARRESRKFEELTNLNNEYVQANQQNFLLENVMKYRASSVAQDLIGQSKAKVSDDLQKAALDPNLLQVDVLNNYMKDRENEAAQMYQKGYYYIADTLMTDAHTFYNGQFNTALAEDNKKIAYTFDQKELRNALTNEASAGIQGDSGAMNFLTRSQTNAMHYWSGAPINSYQTPANMDKNYNEALKSYLRFGLLNLDNIGPQTFLNELDLLSTQATQNFKAYRILSPMDLQYIRSVQKSDASYGSPTRDNELGKGRIVYKTASELMDIDEKQGTDIFSYIDPATGKRVMNPGVISLLHDQKEEAFTTYGADSSEFFAPADERGVQEELYPVLEGDITLNISPENLLNIYSVSNQIRNMISNDTSDKLFMDALSKDFNLTGDSEEGNASPEDLMKGFDNEAVRNKSFTDTVTAIRQLASRLATAKDPLPILKKMRELTNDIGFYQGISLFYAYLKGTNDYFRTSGRFPSNVYNQFKALDTYVTSDAPLPGYLEELVFDAGPTKVDFNTLYYGLIDTLPIDDYTKQRYKRAFIRDLVNRMEAGIQYHLNNPDAFINVDAHLQRDVAALKTKYGLNSLITDAGDQKVLNKSMISEAQRDVLDINKKGATISNNAHSVKGTETFLQMMNENAKMSKGQEPMLGLITALATQGSLGYAYNPDTSKMSTLDKNTWMYWYMTNGGTATDTTEAETLVSIQNELGNNAVYLGIKDSQSFKSLYKDRANRNNLYGGSAENFVAKVEQRLTDAKINPQHRTLLRNAILWKAGIYLDNDKKFTQADLDNMLTGFDKRGHFTVMADYKSGDILDGNLMTYKNGFSTDDAQYRGSVSLNAIHSGYTLDFNPKVTGDKTGEVILRKNGLPFRVTFINPYDNQTMSKELTISNNIGKINSTYGVEYMGGLAGTAMVPQTVLQNLQNNPAKYENYYKYVEKITKNKLKDKPKAGTILRTNLIAVNTVLADPAFHKQLAKDPVLVKLYDGPALTAKEPTYIKSDNVVFKWVVENEITSKKKSLERTLLLNDDKDIRNELQEQRRSLYAAEYILNKAFQEAKGRNLLGAKRNANIDMAHARDITANNVLAFENTPALTGGSTFYGGTITHTPRQHIERHRKTNKNYNTMAFDILNETSVPFLARNAGTVQYIQRRRNYKNPKISEMNDHERGDFGNRIIIENDNGYMVEAFAHLSDKIYIKQGAHVVAGQSLANTGRTGDVQNLVGKQTLTHGEMYILRPGHSMAEERPFLKQGIIRESAFVSVDPVNRKDANGKVWGPTAPTKEATRKYLQSLKGVRKSSASFSDLPDTITPFEQTNTFRATASAVTGDVNGMGYIVYPEEAGFIISHNSDYVPTKEDLSFVNRSRKEYDYEFAKDQAVLVGRFAMAREIIAQTNGKEGTFLAMAGIFPGTKLTFKDFNGDPVFENKTINDIIKMKRDGDLNDIAYGDGKWYISTINKETKELVFA